MPSNFTENYQLSQWVKSDQVKMEDFNADNAKIDAVLGEHAALLPKLGNCQIWTTSYVGAERTSVTFPKKPSLVIIGTNLPYMSVIFPHDTSYTYLNTYASFTWDGNTLTWTGGDLNRKGLPYCVVAFWPMDE